MDQSDDATATTMTELDAYVRQEAAKAQVMSGTRFGVLCDTIDEYPVHASVLKRVYFECDQGDCAMCAHNKRVYTMF